MTPNNNIKSKYSTIFNNLVLLFLKIVADNMKKGKDTHKLRLKDS